VLNLEQHSNQPIRFEGQEKNHRMFCTDIDELTGVISSYTVFTFLKTHLLLVKGIVHFEK